MRDESTVQSDLSGYRDVSVSKKKPQKDKEHTVSETNDKPFKRIGCTCQLRTVAPCDTPDDKCAMQLILYWWWD